MPPDGDDPDPVLRAIARVPDLAPPPQAEAPARIAHFLILGRVGRGGMGVVWRARDEKLGREVALKLLPASQEQDAERRRRLLREARSAAALTHPNVATVYEAGEDEAGRVWIAMELVDGESLRERLASGPLPPEEAVRVFADVVRGIARAHASGIVHRDVKPDNVMLGREVGIKVLDFGLAKATGPLLREPGGPSSTATVEGRVVGTPAYMSPEQLAGRTVDARSDVFSLGVLFYEMVTGRMPFAADSDLELAVAITRDTPASPSKVDARVPPAIDTVVARCLQKDPARRYADARELLDDVVRLGPRLARGGASSRRVVMLAIAGVGVVGAAVAIARGPSWATGDRISASAPGQVGAAAVPTPLAGAATVLACPPLRASGVEAPTGWLGAVAAHVACRRAVYLLGGRLDRTLVPAELLDLPHSPIEGFPADPYVEPDARDRAITAAHTRAQAWFDGQVGVDADGFSVQLRLMTTHDREVGRADGHGSEIYQAVREAMSSLVAAGALPRAEVLDGDARWLTGLRDVDLALGVEDWWLSSGTGGVAAERDRLAPRAAELGPVWWVVQTTTRSRLFAPDDPSIAPPAVDRSSPDALARTALTHAEPDDPEIGPLVDELHARAQLESRRAVREMLMLAEAKARYARRENDAARALSLAVVEEAPRLMAVVDGPWFLLSATSWAGVGYREVAHAYAAWVPEFNDAWIVHPPYDPDARLARMRRMALMSPNYPYGVLAFAPLLVDAGRREEARAVAARIGQSPLGAVTSDLLMTMVEASELRLRPALARARARLASLDRFQIPERGDRQLFERALEAAMIVGQQAPIADAVVARFVEPEPPLLTREHFTPMMVVQACTLASPSVSRGCFRRLHALVAGGMFDAAPGPTATMLDAFERHARGDEAGAAAVLRPWSQTPGFRVVGNAIAAQIFDAVGEPEIAQRFDAPLLEARTYNGVTMAHVRAAKRALARGDRERARALAERVVAAWSTSDTPIPAVAEMRQLLARR